MTTNADLWNAAWGAYNKAYGEFQSRNPGWRSHYTEHHGGALDAALRAYDEARGTLIDPDGAQAPTVVCICGSMRFEATMRRVAVDESLAGRIVVMPMANMKLPDHRWNNDNASDEIKTRLDELHRAKIRMASEVVVVTDSAGYVGDSTRGEIAYAHELGLPVRYVQDHEVTTTGGAS